MATIFKGKSFILIAATKRVGLIQALGPMDRDSIDRVEIDTQGRLHVAPHTADFPFIYRAGMEIGWNTTTRSLHSPKPREWTYERWYRQIIAAAAQEYRCQLFLTDLTAWVNVDAGTKTELIAAHGNGA